MKKFAVLFAIAFCLVLLSSCTRWLPLPVGEWKSNDPNLTIKIIGEDEEGRSLGQYVKDGEVIDVYVGFGIGNGMMEIFDQKAINNHEGMSNENTLFSGKWKIKNDKLYYNLYPYWQKKYGVKTILFERVNP